MNISHTAVIPEELSGKRADQVAAILFPDYSRTRLKSWIESGNLTFDGQKVIPKYKIKAGQTLQLDAELEIQGDWQAQDLGKLDIVYEDNDIIVINKPAGMIVHPGAGNQDHTLLNALLFHEPELKNVPRAGIVHRLDKDTSGLMVVARNMISYNQLIKMFKIHAVEREYEAVVYGVMTGGGQVDAPIGRHPTHRTHMAVVEDGKPAITHFRVIKRYNKYTHIRLTLETGRTHQIRVHMAHIGYPVIGDKAYSGKSSNLINRQALHAKRLVFRHPINDNELEFEVPIASDMEDLINKLTV